MDNDDGVDMRIAILGAGVIGASWTSLFLAHGHDVVVYDVSDQADNDVRRYVENARPTLERLGVSGDGALSFVKDPAVAVEGAGFIQESVPEQIDIKHDLYGRIEPALANDAVITTSASGLMLSELQAGFNNPARLLLGHPFNPPHLIPLVELMANERTDADVIERAERFYQSLGKVTIRVRREVPGHVANRLQAALWREAIHLVKEGVATVEDVDKAVWSGPGLRWAAMGPTMLFHLGAGEGGMAEFCRRYGPSFNRWWDDLGVLQMNDATAGMLAKGVAEEAAGASPEELAKKRDALIEAMLAATGKLRD